MYKMRIIGNLALMVFFGGVGLTMFTDNMRTVQIVGLFACGAAFGGNFVAIMFYIFKSKQPKP